MTMAVKKRPKPKPYKLRRATLRQKRAVANMVENGGIVSRAMIDAGYSPATAKNPDKLTESQAFHDLCKEMGLTEGLVVASLVHDIKKKPKHRSPELSLAADILGMKKRQGPGIVVPVQVNVNTDREKYA